MQKQKFFIYARKSTDTEEKQVASIPAQLRELKEFAAKEGLEIVEAFTESRTAKAPGRPVFNKMLAGIESGVAQGILSWHPDRLARNPIDGGKIIYLLDKGKLQSLKFPTFWFENTPQGKFMLQIAFGQSKYVIDNLSENVKRGLREKLRKGEWPGVAPTGYLNDKVDKKIVIDPERAPKIKKLFERYTTGDYSIYDIRNFSRSLGLVSRNGKELSVSNIQHILQNPFYYGVMKFKGELYEGAHEPIIPQQLFEKAQGVMNNRSKPKSGTDYNWDFLGLFKCGECGRAITAEQQVKKSGLVFRYYRCSKKGTNCSQPYLREEELVSQLNAIIQKVALKDDWKDKMLKQLEKDKRKDTQSSFSLAQNLEKQLKNVESKLDKLLDIQLDGLLSKEEYRAKKEKLLNKKLALQQKLKDFERKGNNWLEPMRAWILEANQAEKIALTENLSQKRYFLKKIGSNFLLQEQKVRFDALPPWCYLQNSSAYPTWLRG